MDPRLVTLAGMRDGAVEEQFQAALRRVLENIDDPNTDHKGKRKIALTFTLTSNEERDVVSIEVATATKLVGAKPLEAIVHLGRVGGARALIEPLRQEQLDIPAGPRGVVQGGTQ